MNKVIKTTLSLTTGLVLTVAANTSFAMDPLVEKALVDTCKSTLSNSPLKMSKTIKSYRLDEKTVALKVMCNGEDIIAFAETHGADRTADRLNKAIGGVDIIDVAKLEKVNVNF